MKASKAEANYKDKPARSSRRCGDCKHFGKMNTCKLVQGIIKASGTCKYYTAKGK
jgi:hypothetical protein